MFNSDASLLFSDVDSFSLIKRLSLIWSHSVTSNLYSRNFWVEKKFVSDNFVLIKVWDVFQFQSMRIKWYATNHTLWNTVSHSFLPSFLCPWLKYRSSPWNSLGKTFQQSLMLRLIVETHCTLLVACRLETKSWILLLQNLSLHRRFLSPSSSLFLFLFSSFFW